jgi:hypothetical protein
MPSDRVDQAIQRINRMTERSNSAAARVSDYLDQKIAAEQRETESAKRMAVREDDTKCQMLANDFNADYRSFNVETPAPRPDEWSADYERRLLRGLQRRLAPSHELSTAGMGRIDEAPPNLMKMFEPRLRAAAAAEARRPSVENLPPAGQFLERRSVDPKTGEAVTNFWGRTSFIADMGRPGRRVVGFRTPHGLLDSNGLPVREV